MLAEIGFVVCWIAFIAAIYAVVVAILGYQRKSEKMVTSARNATYVVFGMLSIALIVMTIGLVSEQYQIAYVWSVSSPSMPMFYRVTALWGSQAGSLLFWCWMMSAFSALAVALNWRPNYRLIPYVIVFQMALTAFFVALTLFIENPFARWWFVGDEVVKSAFMPAGSIIPDAQTLASGAQGLNPLLRHFGMAIHPPMLYLGFVGFLVPCAFAFAALVTGDLSKN